MLHAVICHKSSFQTEITIIEYKIQYYLITIIFLIMFIQ